MLLEKKTEFFEEDTMVPNVSALVKELMLNIFISTYNHKDEEGRCFRLEQNISFIDHYEVETNLSICTTSVRNLCNCKKK